MRILIVSQYFWPETFLINVVVGSLKRAGCEISVLTGQPNYPDGVIFPGYRAGGIGKQIHDGYVIYRVPLVTRGRGSAGRLVANYLSFIASACIFGSWALRKQRYDIVFVYGISPILQAIVGVWFKLIKGAGLVTWVQDLWPESLVVTGFVRNKYILRIVAAVVAWIYRSCDLLLVQSQAFISPVQAMAGNTPVVYFPNPGEVAFTREAEPGNIPALQLTSGFNVVFAGNLGTVQALETLLDAAEILLPYEDIHFVFIGSGSRSVWLDAQVTLRRLSNVGLPGRFPAEAMPGILAQASVLLVSLVRSPIMSQTVPGKVQAYLAAGRPIIAALDGEGARVVLESGAGMACPSEDSAALVQAILKLRATPAVALQRMGEAGRRYYDKNFDPSVLASWLMTQLNDVSERSDNKYRSK
jgi:glycosyltransferase involved in cell wall biosynthesis